MVIDIGAESCIVVKLNNRGRVDDWASHDKCAAGTGMFLQQMSKLMQIPLEEMSALSGRAKGRADITSTCAVFAESDVISHVHRDPPTPPEDIVAGIQNSIASRLAGMGGRNCTPPVIFTGGVAMVPGMAEALSEVLQRDVHVAPDPQMTGALGAAILAARQLRE